MRENTAATNKTVDYVKPAPAINKHKAGAKPKAKHYPTVDDPYSENNGENCSDEQISTKIEVPYSGDYDPNIPTIIAADASSTGIGAVLLQVPNDYKLRSVCYASRSLSDTEKRNALIEKEALAATWVRRFPNTCSGQNRHSRPITGLSFRC